jgi:hypothetical protein
VVLDWDLEYDKLILCPADKNFCAFFPLKGDRCYRLIGTLPTGYDQKENISFEDIEAEVRETSQIPLKFGKVNWFSVYKLHHRCVDSFTKGKVFLAGDSAHIHSPAGGQGMNTGLQDAYNLAWKLAFVLKGYSPPSLLDTYNEERLPFARWLLHFTDRAFTIMTSDNWFIAKFRKLFALRIAGFILTKNFIKPKVFKTVSQIGYNYRGMTLSSPPETKQKLTFQPGDRLPYVEENYYSAFTGACYHLLHITDGPAINPVDAQARFPFPVKVIHDTVEKWKKFGVKSELYLLVRPDNYVSWIGEALK